MVSGLNLLFEVRQISFRHAESLASHYFTWAQVFGEVHLEKGAKKLFFSIVYGFGMHKYERLKYCLSSF